MNIETLIKEIGNTQSYMQALRVIETYYPQKDEQWVIETTDKILELITEAA